MNEMFLLTLTLLLFSSNQVNSAKILWGIRATGSHERCQVKLINQLAYRGHDVTVLR